MSSSQRLKAPLLATLIACASLTAVTSAHAHQVWLENAGGQARLHFGEFNENLRESSPGALDKFLGAPALDQRSAAGTQRLEGKLGKDAFLQLLVTQLKNQNPLDPQDNSAFVAQLAQFSSLEGITTLNTSVNNISGSFKSSQALQASSLVGRMRGGLGQVSILSSLFFGGVSGSAIADVSAIGGSGTYAAWTIGLSAPAQSSAALLSTSSYADPAWLTSLSASKLTGTVLVAGGGTGGTTGVEARANLDVPSRSGVGATGTWGISISGSAASASTATPSPWARPRPHTAPANCAPSSPVSRARTSSSPRARASSRRSSTS